MANNVAGWTEMVNSSATWNGVEGVSSIYCDQAGTGQGGVITRDTSGVISDFTMITDVISNNTGSVGGIVFACSNDGSSYYSMTWKVNWGGGADMFLQDSTMTPGNSVINSWHTGTSICNGGSYKMELSFSSSTGVFSLKINDTLAFSTTVSSPKTAGLIGYGGVNSWEGGNKWDYISITDNGGSTPTRRRIFIIS